MSMDPSYLSALRAGDILRLRSLHDKNPRVLYGKTAEGNSVLHIAASLGNYWAVVDASVALEDLLLHRNARGDTALHCAARAGHDGIVGYLLQRVATPDMCSLQNNRGDTALHDAARGGHVEAARLLLEARPEAAAAVNVDGESALYLAAERGSAATVEVLLGCPTAAHGGLHGQNSLHAAVCRSYEIAEMLLESKPNLNKLVDTSQSAPIHYAASLGNYMMVRLLLQKDHSVARLLAGDGLSALHIAATMGYVNVIEEIIHHCPDATELTDNNGRSFLHAAAEKKQLKVVKHVVQTPMLRGMVNEIDNEGNTSLHLATMNHNQEIIRFLLTVGRADATVRNRRGLTALDLASSCTESSIRLRMNKIMLELISAGSKFSPQRMDFFKDRGRRKNDEEINRYRTVANNLAIVAVLVATVTFAAAFTLPGGYSNDIKDAGMAVLAKKLAFKVFLISDTIAMVSSIAVTCLLIYTGSLDHDIRLHSITTAMKFMCVSLGAMVVAFSMGIYVAVESKCTWLAVLICVMACSVPFIAWKIACWPVFGSLKLMKKTKNQGMQVKKTSIFKVAVMPGSIVVDFETPTNTEYADRPTSETSSLQV